MHDLSHPFVDGLQTYPTDDPVQVTPAAEYETAGYRSTRIETGSHAGTHVDAPAHMLENGKELAEYSVDQFVFDAAKVDCRDLGPREPIPADRVPTDETIDVVLFQTDWDEHWGTDRYLDHPYLDPEAAAVCAERGFAVGTDTLNPDPTPTLAADASEPDGFQAHEAILGAEALIFENLTGLEQVPERFELRAYPVPLQVDGAPVRAVGVED